MLIESINYLCEDMRNSKTIKSNIHIVFVEYFIIELSENNWGIFEIELLQWVIYRNEWFNLFMIDCIFCVENTEIIVLKYWTQLSLMLLWFLMFFYTCWSIVKNKEGFWPAHLWRLLLFIRIEPMKWLFKVTETDLIDIFTWGLGRILDEDNTLTNR
jgi:hypothetical protein